MRGTNVLNEKTSFVGEKPQFPCLSKCCSLREYLAKRRSALGRNQEKYGKRGREVTTFYISPWVERRISRDAEILPLSVGRKNLESVFLGRVVSVTSKQEPQRRFG